MRNPFSWSTPSQAASAVFLEPSTAASLLLDDSIDEFIGALSPRAARAMFGADARSWSENASILERHAILAHAVETFTEEERELLSSLVDALVHTLGEEYTKVTRSPWEFAKLAPGLSADTFAFTRGSCIFLPAALIQKTLDASFGAGAPMETLSFLAHEKMHVLQRLMPEPFHQLYQNDWGCRRVRKVDWGDAHAWFGFKYLPNPDALDFWAVPTREEGVWTLTLPVLNGRHRPSRLEPLLDWLFPPSMIPFSFAIVEVTMDGDVARVRTNGKDHPVFRPDCEADLTVDHPNEVSAELFGMLMSAEETTSLEPDTASFRQWCRVYLR